MVNLCSVLCECIVVCMEKVWYGYEKVVLYVYLNTLSPSDFAEALPGLVKQLTNTDSRHRKNEPKIFIENPQFEKKISWIFPVPPLYDVCGHSLICII